MEEGANEWITGHHERRCRSSVEFAAARTSSDVSLRRRRFSDTSKFTTKARNNSGSPVDADVDQISSVSAQVVDGSLSEQELDEIKQAFKAIHGLWHDVSVGSDTISMSLLSSVHDQLGEIGSEMFSQLFLSRSENSKSEVNFVSLNFLLFHFRRHDVSFHLKCFFTVFKTTILDSLDEVSFERNIWVWVCHHRRGGRFKFSEHAGRASIRLKL